MVFTDDGSSSSCVSTCEVLRSDHQYQLKIHSEGAKLKLQYIHAVREVLGGEDVSCG